MEDREIRRTFVRLGNRLNDITCMIYEPRLRDKRGRVGIVLIHPDANYMEYQPAIELARRGCCVLASHFVDTAASLDRKITEVAKLVRCLKDYPGIEKILLLGHSGGATLMSAYQSVAENGARVFQGEEKVAPLDEIGDIPAADGVMLLDSNLGNGVMTLLSLDPAVVDEDSGMVRDPKLDLYNPENGYCAGNCTYSEAFLKKFWRAQAERMNRLIDYCQERVALIEVGKGRFADDEPLIVPGGSQFALNNKLIPQVPSYFSHTRQAWDLIHKDGSITHQIIPCLRKAHPGENLSGSWEDGVLYTSVRTFLKSVAVRVDPEIYGYDESEIYGIDWSSSYCNTVGNVEEISAPLLIMGMTGSYEYIASEHIFEHAKKSSDKVMAFVEGAGHHFFTEAEAERFPGELGDTMKSCFDYVEKWIEERFV